MAHADKHIEISDGNRPRSRHQETEPMTRLFRALAFLSMTLAATLAHADILPAPRPGSCRPMHGPGSAPTMVRRARIGGSA